MLDALVWASFYIGGGLMIVGGCGLLILISLIVIEELHKKWVNRLYPVTLTKGLTSKQVIDAVNAARVANGLEMWSRYAD